MPNPNDPEQVECQRCHDTGFIPGTYRLCNCTGHAGASRSTALDQPVLGVLTHTHTFAAQLSVIDGAPTKVCGIRLGDGTLCHRREEEHR